MGQAGLRTKRAGVTLLFALATALSLLPGRVEAQAAGPSRFTLGADLLFWTRAGGDTPPINELGPGDVISPNEILYDFDDVPRDGYRPGSAFTLAYQLDDTSQVWARGFFILERARSRTLCIIPGCGVSGGTSSTFSFAPGNLTTTNNTRSGFTAFDSETTSSVWGVELNYDRAVVGGAGGFQVRAFGGPRFIRFHDHIEMRFFENVADLQGTGDQVQGVDILVINNLVGAQAGADARLPLTSTLSVGARASFGLFANVVEREREFREFQAGFQFKLADSRTWTRFAQVVEAGLTLMWDFWPNWTASVGYQALFMNDVSVAPSHFRTVAVRNDSASRADSSVIFHGTMARIGLRF